jgi:hypothetical protein
MPNIFGIDLASEIAEAFDGELLTGTFVRQTFGARTPGSLSGGKASTPTEFTFQGFLETKDATYKSGTLIREAGSVISILGASISPVTVPKTGDVVTIEGATFTLLELLSRDPAAAVYSFSAKG